MERIATVRRSADARLRCRPVPQSARHGPEPITVDRSIGGDRPLILPVISSSIARA